MDYNKRIDDNFLKAEYVDGEVLQHTDMNELESVVKLGVNANYEDIQKIQDGTISVENSNKLSGATIFMWYASPSSLCIIGISK